MNFRPYLLFDGTCSEAMKLYHSCFGGKLAITKVGDSPAKEQMPIELHEKVINAILESDSLSISGSDWLRTDIFPTSGNTMAIFLQGMERRELERIFKTLSYDGSDITSPTEQFFGLYASLTDRFGTRWMLHSDLKQ